MSHASHIQSLEDNGLNLISFRQSEIMSEKGAGKRGLGGGRVGGKGEKVGVTTEMCMCVYFFYGVEGGPPK